MSKSATKSGIAKPSWLKVRACGSKRYLELQSLLRKYSLHTVCQEANCPNRSECFSSGTATFLILGPNCTRNCTFCNVTHGEVHPVDENEPVNLACAVDVLGLSHVVITSVTRDDLPDGGAGQFVKVIRAIRRTNEHITIEILTPDFMGCRKDVEMVLEAQPDVFNHNIETVPRLYSKVRPDADYERSLQILKIASKTGKIAVKSGIMVGLGEAMSELRIVLKDLYSAGVEYLTIGQYLAPSENHHPIAKYYHPSDFVVLADMARRCGIRSVLAAPLVRSSYRAKELYRSQ